MLAKFESGIANATSFPFQRHHFCMRTFLFLHFPLLIQINIITIFAVDVLSVASIFAVDVLSVASIFAVEVLKVAAVACEIRIDCANAL